MNKQEAIQTIQEMCKRYIFMLDEDKAIDMAIEALQEPKIIIGIDIPYGNDKGIAAIFKGKDDKLILEKVKELMSDWIPVSERLPEVGEYVLASVHDDYSDCNIIVNEYREQAFWNNGRILAWQPLPEPYKGGDTE